MYKFKTGKGLTCAIKRTCAVLGLGAGFALSAQSASASCSYSIDNEWSSGFVASITITNDTNTAINNWSVNWQYASNQIASGWNANISGSNPYTATNMAWNGSIAPGQSVSFGLQGEKNGGNAERPTITGSVCGGGSTSSAPASSSSSSLPVSSSSSSVSSSSSSLASSLSSSSSSTPGNAHSTCPSQPENAFQMYAPTIPARIQAEDFDPEGYADSSTENEGGEYRTDTSVDIKAIAGGNAVGWMTNGEWLEYTVYVEQTGDYDLTIRSGSVDAGRSLKVSQCGTTLLESFSVPVVNDWGQFKTWSAGRVHLQAGYQKIRLEVGSQDYLDLDWIQIGPYDGTIDQPDNPTCALPSTFSWTSTGPLISPQRSNWASVKDPSIVHYDGLYHIFATVFDTSVGANGSWGSIYMNFSDWNQAGSATQIPFQGTAINGAVAPQVFFFRPHNRWYQITQWAGSYSTTTDITNPASWSAKQKLLQGEPSGALDFWVICNDSHCYLYFSRDDGVLYMSKTTIDNFPNFSGYSIVMEDHRGDGKSFLFEAANVYKVDGANQYLLLVEAYRSPGYGPRYFRSWTANSLDGPWTPLADTEENPFAGNNNVEWPQGAWANGISHGELVRSGYDERLTIDPCNLEFVYQGETGTASSYDRIPYKLGLLRLKR